MYYQIVGKNADGDEWVLETCYDEKLAKALFKKYVRINKQEDAGENDIILRNEYGHELKHWYGG